MCLLAMAWRVHPRYPLLVLGNRDEWHARPTAELAYDSAAPDVLGGRDLLSGGSWLELSRTRRVAAVTNVRRPGAGSTQRSRGALVSEFTRGSQSAVQQAQCCAQEAAAGPFNLLLYDGAQLVFASNCAPRWQILEPGVHLLSNGDLNAGWPKMQRLRSAFEQTLAQAGCRSEQLLELLTDRRSADDHELPDTGVGLPLERLLAPVFIAGDEYGTRSSSVLLLGEHDWQFHERRFGPAGRVLGERVLSGGWSG